MSTNAGAIHSSSDAVVSSELPSNSVTAVSKGITVVVGTDSLDSKTETLTTEPSSGGIAVHDLLDDARVSGGELGIVTDTDEKVLGSVTPAASYGITIGNDLLESSSGTIIVDTSYPVQLVDDGVQDSVDDARVSVDEIGIVTNNSGLVLDKLISDAIGASEQLSSDHNGGADAVVQGSIDDSGVSGDEKGIVMDISEPVLEKSISDVVLSEPLTNRDIDAVNEVKTGADSVGSKTETPTRKSTGDHNSDGGIVVQDSIEGSKDEKGIVMNNSELVLEKSISDAVVLAEPVTNKDIDTVNEVKTDADSSGSKIETSTMKSPADHNGDGDIIVQDSVDVSRASRDEIGIVIENNDKHSDRNEVIYEEKEGEYKVTDIIWAKVKNYPWWPGQIFDPSSATDKAKKFSNKKGFLVGYFGDQTFAWNKVSNIKPFRKNFCKLEKQSNSKAFSHAVDCALDEVSRRVEFGLACSCLSKEVYDKIKSQDFVNAGIRKEASKIDGGDRFSTVSTFKPVKAVQSLQELAIEHYDGFSRLEALSVRTQVLAFFRWKCCNQLKTENILDGLDNKLEDDSELPLMEENKMVEDEKPTSVGKKVSSKKRKPDVCDSDDSFPHKKGRSLTSVSPNGNSNVKGSKKDASKKTTVEDIVVKEENGNEKPASVGKKVSSKKRKADVCDSDDSVPRKKERSLTNTTSKDNSGVKRSKKGISKNATVEVDNVFKKENGDEKTASVGKKVSSKKRKEDVCDSDDSVPCKKERSLTNSTSKGNLSVKRSKKGISKNATVEDNIFKKKNGNGSANKQSSISSPKKLFRVGDSICRIAKQISESPSVVVKESQKSKNDENSATRNTSEKDGQPVAAIETEE